MLTDTVVIPGLTWENEASRRGAINATDGSDPPIRAKRRRAGVSLPIEEQWRPVPGYGGIYRVSDHGRVWTIARDSRPGRLLKQTVRADGYVTVRLYRNGIPKTRTVHQLVAEAFYGPRPTGQEVRHLDGNPGNNRATNLCWGTRSENMRDRVRHGTDPNARKTHCPQGHPYNEANTVRNRLTGRTCRICINARANRRPVFDLMARHDHGCEAGLSYGSWDGCGCRKRIIELAKRR